MHKQRLIFSVIVLFLSFQLCVHAQVDLKYQMPHDDIRTLADAELAPSLRMNKDLTQGILLSRDSYKSIAELSETELRLAGLRINPITNIGSRTRYSNNIQLFNPQTGITSEISGLPEQRRIANVSWSPDQSKIAFTNTDLSGVQLYVLDLSTGSCSKICEDHINGNMGLAINWLKDSESILVSLLPKDRSGLVDTKTAIPSGPTISVNDGGKKAQNRTYQDLLKNKADEHNFKALANSEIWKVHVDGTKMLWLEAELYSDLRVSPDGKYVMVETIMEPFSYLVPYYRFPSSLKVYNVQGDVVQKIADFPLVEDLPKGFMAVRKGPRSISWRRDVGSTLYWAEALDEGDPDNEVAFRDEVYQWEAPFKNDPKPLIKTKYRYSGITWGVSTIAVSNSYWRNSRTMRTVIFDPSDATKKPVLFSERNYQDRYNNPGRFATKRNEFGSYVLETDANNLYLLGEGYSDNGKHPFVDAFNLESKETKRLYEDEDDKMLESLASVIDIKKGLVLTRLESKTDFPNYFLRNIKLDDLTRITNFENPFKAIQDVHKEVINYKREDGVELSGTLYLPVGYDKENKEKMPMILWAYPVEYKDKSSAGQTTSSSNEFTYPWYGSPIFWVNRGYVVLDDAAFPIIGEGDEEPNDYFRKQLVDNAKAAIDAVDNMGYIDRNRVAVGGHSYGAFMTANLLSHCDLFAAGIARSGAYNRTLTPFGFQSEERNYWEAPNIYYEMSPFMHADKMKTPLLLIHGEADNNSGTYPMQSERYFNALKGLGATVRLVMLPKESHGYAAKESIMHMLWEQDQWLEKYVKNRDIDADIKP